jgi:hypothetical protein
VTQAYLSGRISRKTCCRAVLHFHPCACLSCLLVSGLRVSGSADVLLCLMELYHQGLSHSVARAQGFSAQLSWTLSRVFEHMYRLRASPELGEFAHCLWVA